MIDLQAIKAFYQIDRKLDFEDVRQILEAAENRHYRAGENIIPEGSLRKELHFIQKGLVRSFAINNKGEEITTAIYWEHLVVASPDILLFQQASRFTFQAMEDCDVWSIDYDLMQNLLSKNTNLLESRKFILQNMLRMALSRIETFVLMNPEERYLDLIAKHPDLNDRVPNKYLANILGITPVSLSRIRKRISEKKK